MKPRARRTALIEASVPELTKRTFSIEGTASMMTSANWLSISVGAPETGAATQRVGNGCLNARVPVPQDQRPPRADVIEVAVAIDVKEIGTFASVNEQRLAANRSKGAPDYSPHRESIAWRVRRQRGCERSVVSWSNP